MWQIARGAGLGDETVLGWCLIRRALICMHATALSWTYRQASNGNGTLATLDALTVQNGTQLCFLGLQFSLVYTLPYHHTLDTHIPATHTPAPRLFHCSLAKFEARVFNNKSKSVSSLTHLYENMQ